MKLFYYEDPGGNFGDDLNAWLWPRIAPELLDGDESTLFVGIGSILDRRIPQGPRKIVFGTGVGYGLLPVLDDTWQICCVRGPLTASALGLPPDLAITDPAALVANVRAPTQDRTHKVSFIPHFRTPARLASMGVDLRQICGDLGINYIDPCGSVEKVLAGIESSRKVVAEAMHGAIVADALRVPWVPVQLSDKILYLKWHDWCGSLNLEYKPLVYRPARSNDYGVGIADFLHRAAISTESALSDPHALSKVLDRLNERLDALRAGRFEGCVQGSADFQPDASVLREVPWLYDMQMALEELGGVLPLGATFILVDEQRWGGGEVLAGRHTLPFLERDGAYWGLPENSETAIRELERLREGGAQYLVFMRPSLWWLDHYAVFREHLSRYPVVARSERITVYELH